MQAIHTPKARRLTLAASLLLLLTTSGLAQTASPAPASDSAQKKKTDQEDTVVLSPFVVDADKDVGYQATQTLAGSRINTDLKDVSQSITVVTKAFITDLAATDINDILAYTGGTEGSRDFTSSTSSLGRPTDDIAANPNTSNRIRGLTAADLTRDYFYTIGTWAGFDTYNLDEVTIVRGPNSILAGLGSPAGIINYSPQLAQLNRTKNELSYRFGSYGDQRATLNSNIVAVKDMLAVRVAALWADEGFEQEPAYNKSKRIYGTLTYQPWKKTTIRASYEWVKNEANNPNTLTPEDDVSQWIALGKPIYDSTSAAPVSPYLTANFGYPNIIVNKSGAVEGAYNFAAQGYTFYQQNLANVGIWTAQRMKTDQYFNLHDVNLSPSLQELEQKTFNISVDQEIAHGLFANIAYVNEKVDNNFLNLFRTEYAVYSIDVNKFLPGGAANPHFMETYFQYRGLDNKQEDHNSNEVIRGTLTYDLDLNKYNKWFGRWRATVFGEDRKTETDHLQWNARQVGGTDESIGYRYYLGGSDTKPATAVPQQPQLYQGVQYLPNNGTLNTYYGLKSDSRQVVKLKTFAGVLQPYLWDDKIVGMLGIRRDENEAGFSSAANGSGGNVNPAPDVSTYGPKIAETTKTYGVVVHPLKWLSLHYNHSENFIPNAGSVDLLGNATPSPTGLTKDYGFSLNLIDNKLYAKVNWFELTAANASAGNANFPLAQWTVPYMELTFMPDLARQAGITYKPYIASGLITGDPRLANAYTSDTVSKGVEIELTYNVTKNWRVMASVTNQEAKQSNIASGLTDFIENRLAYWKSIPALWTGPYVGQNVGWGVGRTGQQQWNNDNQPYYLAYKSAEGKPSTQLPKWHASGLTNYEFVEGPMKGFNMGAGVRYIEKSVIGNPAIQDSSGTVIGLDLDHPYYNGSYFAVDAWIGYKMKLEEGKYELSFQLNGRDLAQNADYRPIVANSDGNHSVYRIVPGRTFYLSTTLGF